MLVWARAWGLACSLANWEPGSRKTLVPLSLACLPNLLSPRGSSLHPGGGGPRWCGSVLLGSVSTLGFRKGGSGGPGGPGCYTASKARSPAWGLRCPSLPVEGNLLPGSTPPRPWCSPVGCCLGRGAGGVTWTAKQSAQLLGGKGTPSCRPPRASWKVSRGRPTSAWCPHCPGRRGLPKHGCQRLSPGS